MSEQKVVSPRGKTAWRLPAELGQGDDLRRRAMVFVSAMASSGGLHQEFLLLKP